jgi:hypothetical protein
MGTSCHSVLSVYHNSKGEKNYLSYIHMRIKKYSYIAEYDYKIGTEIKKRAEEQKKKKLASDF